MATARTDTCVVQRESVPFQLRTADGDTHELTYYSSGAGNADLGKLQAQFDEYYETLERNGVRVNYIDAPVPAIGTYGYLKNLVTLAGGGLVVRGGAIIHRMGLGSWQRGREVIWSKVLTALKVPVYLTIHGRGIGEPGAGR